MAGGLRKSMVTGFDAIVGQDHAVSLLVRMLERDRLPHALLFSGVDGVGKQTTARVLATVMNCRNSDRTSACMVCPSCKQSMSGNHPDVITIEPRGRFIKLDQMRSLQKQIRFAPLAGAHRVVIINEAQEMNMEAANAILKLLEEPPKNTYIVMTCRQVSDLVPTIVSRCQQVAFTPLPVAAIAAELVKRRQLDQDTALAVASLAKGSIGNALSCNVEKWLAWRKACLDEIASLPRKSMYKTLVVAEGLTKPKDKVQDVLDLVLMWFRDILMYKLQPSNVINTDRMTTIVDRSANFSIEHLLAIISAVFRVQRAIEQNANPRLAFEVLLICHVGLAGLRREAGRAVAGGA